jgi:hypothetical protein
VIWLGWRQQRTESLIAAALLALLVALLVPTGLQMASAYHHDGLSACLAANSSAGCSDAIHAFTVRFESIGNLMAWLTIVPGLIGVLLAAPLVLQLESGTYRLDWTQSITRGRWIAGKLILAVAVASVASFVFVELITWWRAPLVRLNGRMDPSVFDSEGVVAFGYAWFALGLALAVGVLWRRAVAALVVAFVGYFAARIFVDTWLRQRLTPPLSATFDTGHKGEPAALHNAFVVSEHPSDRLGHEIVPQIGPCLRAAPSSVRRCVAEHSSGYIHAVFEPASRFWSMQFVEFGLFAAVAFALIAFSAWWTHSRVA